MRIYTPEGREWFTEGDLVAGVVVLNIRKEAPVGHITATLKCVERDKVSRIKVKSKKASIPTREIKIYDVERYVGNPVLVTDLGNRTPASRLHEFPFQVVMPREMLDLPPSFDNWELSFGRNIWYGVKWVVELDTGGIGTNNLICESQPLLVFPRGAQLKTNVFKQKELVGNITLQLAPPADERHGFRRLLHVAQYGDAGVRMSMATPNFAQAEAPVDITLGLEADQNDVVILERVTVKLHSLAKARTEDWRESNETALILAEWFPYTELHEGTLDLTPQFYSNFRPSAHWSCDFSTETLTVTHFLCYTVKIIGKWSPLTSRTFYLRQQIVIIPPSTGWAQLRRTREGSEAPPDYAQVVER